MKKKFRIICFSFLAILHASFSFADNPFVTIRLVNGIMFELPKNWVVIDTNTKTTLEASVAARIPIDINTSLPFAANLYNFENKTIGLINVRVYPDMDFYQQDVKNMSPLAVKEFDAILQKNIALGVLSSGHKVTNWMGTEKIIIEDRIFLLSRYRRQSGLDPNRFFRVGLLRLLDGKNSFTLTLSYEEKEHYLLYPIINKIMNSTRVLN